MEIDKTKIIKRKVDLNKAKSLKVTIRISKDISTYLNENKISPTGLFYEALRVIGYNETKKE